MTTFLKKLFNVASYLLRHPLTKDKFFGAYKAFLRWQLGVRLVDRKTIHNWIDESRLICGRGETGITGNIYAGLAEFEEMTFLMHTLSREDTFVDIGANSGAYTVLASKVVGAYTMAYEPSPTAVLRLTDNILINNISKLVSINQKAVGASIGKLYMTVDGDTTNRICDPRETTNYLEVDVTSLDTQLVGERTYFIKIDVEGYEGSVIKGAESLLRTDKVKALIVEINGGGLEYSYTNENLHMMIRDFGFSPISYDPYKRVIKEITSYNIERQNTIYVRDLELMRRRAECGARRKVHGFTRGLI